MKTVRVGGVPEHFNYAWYIGLKNNLFKENGINGRLLSHLFLFLIMGMPLMRSW
mgnify:CR=1 FL=1